MVEAPQEKFPDLSGLTLLVVDDEPGIVRSLERVFTGLGAEVTGVGSIREARLQVADRSPDALLADLQLKDGTGLELLPEYLQRNPAGAFYTHRT